MRSTPRSPRTHHTVLWHTSLPPPIFRSSTSRIRGSKVATRERIRLSVDAASSSLFHSFPQPRFIRSETGLFFFPRHLPFRSLPSRGFGFRSSENAITLFTKCCTTDSSTTSGLPPDRFSAVRSSTNAVPSSSSLMMSRWMDGGSNTEISYCEIYPRLSKTITSPDSAPSKPHPNVQFKNRDHPVYRSRITFCPRFHSIRKHASRFAIVYPLAVFSLPSCPSRSKYFPSYMYIATRYSDIWNKEAFTFLRNSNRFPTFSTMDDQSFPLTVSSSNRWIRNHLRHCSYSFARSLLLATPPPATLFPYLEINRRESIKNFAPPPMSWPGLSSYHVALRTRKSRG